MNSYNDSWGRARKSRKPGLCLSCLGSEYSCPVHSYKSSGHSCLQTSVTCEANELVNELFLQGEAQGTGRLGSRSLGPCWERQGLSMSSIVDSWEVHAPCPLLLLISHPCHTCTNTAWIWPKPALNSLIRKAWWGAGGTNPNAPWAYWQDNKAPKAPKTQPTGTPQLLNNEDGHVTKLFIWLLWTL